MLAAHRISEESLHADGQVKEHPQQQLTGSSEYMMTQNQQNNVIPEEMDFVNVENDSERSAKQQTEEIKQQDITDTTINVEANDKIEEPNLASINNDSMYSVRGANITNLTNDDNFNASPIKHSIMSGS